jgi:tRNA dimethylallyltransferase
LNRLFAGRGEVISADSRQVYRFLNIGAAKPSPALLSRLPHHLLDLLDPGEPWTAGDFVRRTEALIPEILARGRIPVVSGGTAFYLRSFLYGLPQAPPADPDVRQALRRRLETQGLEALYGELAERDPVSAARIAPRDAYRILRALEVWETAGVPLSSFPPPDTLRRDFRFLLLGLARPREELYQRINRRTEGMFREGLYREFLGLLSRGYGPRDPGLKSIGYKEFFELQSNGCRTLGGVREEICRNTRRYAKSQLIFLKALKPGWRWFHPEKELGELESLVENFISSGDNSAL